MGKEFVGLSNEELCDLMCGTPEEDTEEDFVLTSDNYYSKEANEKYMSFHQYLSFAGGMLSRGCEERALKALKGEWVDPTTDAMLIGSYVDSYFEGTLDEFKLGHPECFTQKGELKAGFKKADAMIERCKKDPYFMKYMSGEKQRIMTGYWGGCDWRIKMDSYIPGRCIVDLKTSADIHKAWKIDNYGYATFVEAYNYDKQLALYQKIVEINTGEKLKCYIAVVTKGDEPEIEIIHIDQESLDFALSQIETNLPSVLAVKSGEVTPMRCEKCDYCLRTKKLTKPINFRKLIEES